MKGLTIILFGGTGNLAYKKLYPAFYNLFHKGLMPDEFKLISVGRRVMDNQSYKEIVYSKIIEYSDISDSVVVNDFVSYLEYQQLDFNEFKDYKKLKYTIDDCIDGCDITENRIFFLAAAPRYFEVITSNLSKVGVLDIKDDAFKRIVIEKPFGNNLEDAKEINKMLCKVFDETEIYRTDHYLGKSMIQNIMILRFSNAIFEPLWNKDYIDNVQITVSETIGIEERGRYYEESGALRDMIQSHLLQILALFAMEPPDSLDTEEIRNEKVKVLQSMKCFDKKDILRSLVLGQYVSNGDVKSYNEENYVDSNSLTETFVALRIEINNPRWDGVGFYLRTGKRLKRKVAEIVVQFKDYLSFNLYGSKLNPNLLRIKIQPDEGMSLSFNLKDPSTENIIIDRTMDFCQNCDVMLKSPEAYEKLILDVLTGDQSLYSRWDEVEASWAFVDKISKTCHDRNKLLKKYYQSTWGPKESDEMMKKHHLKWWTE